MASDGFTRCATLPYDTPFAALDDVISDVRWRDHEAVCGVSVYRFSDDEARFVVRGELGDPEDLRACITHAEASALALGCSRLVTQEKLRSDWLAAESVCYAEGFVQLDTSLVFECPFTPLASRSKRAVHALERREAIPAAASVTSLKEGMSAARNMLNAASIMDDFDFDSRLAAHSTKPVSAQYSRLVWLDDALIGIVLVAPTPVDAVYEIPVRFIAPSYRQTWVNTLLIHSCVQYGEAYAAEAIRFNANPEMHQETISLANSIRGQHIATSHRYGKDLSTKRKRAL